MIRHNHHQQEILFTSKHVDRSGLTDCSSPCCFWTCRSSWALFHKSRSIHPTHRFYRAVEIDRHDECPAILQYYILVILICRVEQRAYCTWIAIEVSISLKWKLVFRVSVNTKYPGYRFNINPLPRSSFFLGELLVPFIYRFKTHLVELGSRCVDFAIETHSRKTNIS